MRLISLLIVGLLAYTQVSAAPIFQRTPLDLIARADHLPPGTKQSRPLPLPPGQAQKPRPLPPTPSQLPPDSHKEATGTESGKHALKQLVSPQHTSDGQSSDHSPPHSRSSHHDSDSDSSYSQLSWVSHHISHGKQSPPPSPGSGSNPKQDSQAHQQAPPIGLQRKPRVPRKQNSDVPDGHGHAPNLGSNKQESHGAPHPQGSGSIFSGHGTGEPSQLRANQPQLPQTHAMSSLRPPREHQETEQSRSARQALLHPLIIPGSPRPQQSASKQKLGSKFLKFFSTKKPA